MIDLLMLRVDLSSTGPKFFYGEGDKWHPCSFAPQVVLVRSDDGDSPEHMVIRLGEEIYLTGQAASNYLHGRNYLKEAKASKAIPQILSAIVYAAEALGLPNKFDLDIKCLLPAGEIKEDRESLEKELTNAVKSFGSMSKKWRGRLRSFDCKPEGFGLLLKFGELCGFPLTELSIGVLSIGYRNCGFFSSINQKPGHYQSPRLGFSVLISEFRSMVGGTDEMDLTKDLTKFLETGNKEHLTTIARLGKDVDRVAASVEEARERYLEKLQRYAAEELPAIERMIVAGGGAQVLEPYLYQCLYREKLSFHAGLGKAWNYPNELKDKLKDDLAHRFADLYCFC
jgi:hypothetical protein